MPKTRGVPPACHVNPAKFSDAELCLELRNPHIPTYMRRLQAEACARVLERQEDSPKVRSLIAKARSLAAAKRESEALYRVFTESVAQSRPTSELQDKVRVCGAKVKRLQDEMLRAVMEL